MTEKEYDDRRNYLENRIKSSLEFLDQWKKTISDPIYIKIEKYDLSLAFSTVVSDPTYSTMDFIETQITQDIKLCRKGLVDLDEEIVEEEGVDDDNNNNESGSEIL